MKKGGLYYLCCLCCLCLTFQLCIAGTISLAFSDGYKIHTEIAKILKSHNINATFYVNTETIKFNSQSSQSSKSSQSSQYLNVFDIDDLVKSDFEIGGHTVNHIDLTNGNLTTTTMLEEICRDRATLIANGWHPTSFSYPYGKHDYLSQKLVEECGYNSALINRRINTTTPTIEKIAHYVGDINEKNDYDNVINFIDFAYTQWIVLNFHNISKLRVDDFNTFLTRLENIDGIRFNSVDGVIGGSFNDLPIEFANTLPTPTPDRRKILKIYIGMGCITILSFVVFYVILTTKIKRTVWGKKIKFCC